LLQPWVTTNEETTNAESVGEPRDLANAFSVGNAWFVGFPQGSRKLEPWAETSQRLRRSALADKLKRKNGATGDLIRCGRFDRLLVTAFNAEGVHEF